MKAFKAFMKTFEASQRNVKIKFFLFVRDRVKGSGLRENPRIEKTKTFAKNL